MDTNEIILGFFGYVISVRSNDKDIISQIKYIYREYENRHKTEPNYYFYIENQDNQKYLMSELLENNNIVVFHGINLNSMERWNDENTFLPPITAPYFRDVFSFYHGCAIKVKERTIMVLGPSLSGKTTLLMEAMDRGAKLICDDIIIINNKSKKILPFKKPIAIRNTSRFYRENRILDAVSRKPKCIPTFNITKMNLVTELVHITEISQWEYFDEESIVDEIYFIGGESENRKIDSFYEFYYNLTKQACISNDNLKLFVEIYKNLKSPPMIINIRNHKEVWKILDI